MKSILPYSAFVAFLLLAQWSTALLANSKLVEVGYSFRKKSSGGIATAIVAPDTGKIVGYRTLLDSPKCLRPLKVRRTPNGQLVVTNYSKKDPQLFIVSLSKTKTAQKVRLPAEPDELRIVDNQGIVTCEKDILAIVDIARARVESSWDVSKVYRPAANSPQGIFITANQQYAVISFQKDSVTGKKKGSRLAVYELPKMIRVADLQLPRNRPEVHIKTNRKEQGPGPEISFVSGNTLMVTLDLYGGVGFMDWSAAKINRMQNWTDLPTSLDGRWGVAFPDRVCPVSLGNFRGILVCNAGEAGGIVLVDLNQRNLVWKQPVPPGLEHPVFIPELKKAYSVCSGKIKIRQKKKVTKVYHPQKSLYCVDFTSGDVAAASVTTTPISDDFAMRVTRIGTDRPLLLIALGAEPEKPTIIATFDPITNRVLDSKPAVGILGRFER
ncbi:MAG: hypothetical protein P8N76_12675 [Pirellulaceae bacterium]|nr:hypothetical protein [Pirellulaceae bacterium]